MPTYIVIVEDRIACAGKIKVDADQQRSRSNWLPSAKQWKGTSR